MLLRISDRVAFFFERAADCHEKMQKARDSAERKFYLEMEQHWLSLAHHREQTERLKRLTAEIAKRTRRSR